MKMKFREWFMKYGRFQEDFGQGIGVGGSASFWYGAKDKPFAKRKKVVLPEPEVDLSKQGIQATSRDEGSA